MTLSDHPWRTRALMNLTALSMRNLDWLVANDLSREPVDETFGESVLRAVGLVVHLLLSVPGPALPSLLHNHRVLFRIRVDDRGGDPVDGVLFDPCVHVPVVENDGFRAEA